MVLEYQPYSENRSCLRIFSIIRGEPLISLRFEIGGNAVFAELPQIIEKILNLDMSKAIANTLLEYLTTSSLSLPVIKGETDIMEEILQIYKQKGGATFSPYFGDQMGQPFFAVGLDNNLTQFPSLDTFASDIAVFLRANRSLLTHPRCCIGLWEEYDDNQIPLLFLDITVLVYNKDIAREFALEGDQIALFSLKTEEEMTIGGTGEPANLRRLRRLEQIDSLHDSEGAV